MVFVSISLRLEVDVEAMNMVEPMGAYTRHRTVPMVKSRGNGRYTIVMAPAISGQSLAFAYQAVLVELAKQRGLPLCNACENYKVIGGFVKLSGDINNCVVEDITGFMVAAEKGQMAKRRTSTISFSYMLPDLEGASAHIEPQLHVRYNFLQPQLQQPFEIETATAVYTVSIALDPEKIGVEELGTYKDDRYSSERKEVNNRKDRVELAFDALKVVFEGQVYGAKKSRVLPIAYILGAIASISNPMPFAVTPARIRSDTDHYINETWKRAFMYVKTLREENIYIAYMDKEGLKVEKPRLDSDEVAKRLVDLGSADTFSELIDKIKNKVIEMLFKQTS